MSSRPSPFASSAKGQEAGVATRNRERAQLEAGRTLQKAAFHRKKPGRGPGRQGRQGGPRCGKLRPLGQSGRPTVGWGVRMLSTLPWGGRNPSWESGACRKAGPGYEQDRKGDGRKPGRASGGGDPGGEGKGRVEGVERGREKVEGWEGGGGEEGWGEGEKGRGSEDD